MLHIYISSLVGLMSYGIDLPYLWQEHRLSMLICGAPIPANFLCRRIAPQPNVAL
jgi:hypothetical protein